MKKYDVITALDLCVDLLVQLGSAEPEFGQKEKLVDGYNLELGGSCSIFASQCAKLGLKTAGIGRVGDDVFGKFILEKIKTTGIISDWILSDDNLSTGLGVALCKADDRAILTYSGSLDSVIETDFPDALFENTRHMHIGSYFLMKKLQPAYPRILKKAKAKGMTISLDTNWDPDEKWDSGIMNILPMIDIFLPNRNELINISKERSYPNAVSKISEIVPILVVKNGEKGSDSYYQGNAVHLDALTIELADAVGAGDNFDAGFVFAYLSGFDIKTCLQVATVCGSISAEKFGGIDGQPGIEEINKFLDNN